MYQLIQETFPLIIPNGQKVGTWTKIHTKHISQWSVACRPVAVDVTRRDVDQFQAVLFKSTGYGQQVPIMIVGHVIHAGFYIHDAFDGFSMLQRRR